MMLPLAANRSILKAACMRAIFNSDGSISDIRRSVLVQVSIPGKRGGMTLYSSTDFDLLPDLRETSPLLPEGSTIEVWDGRLLSTNRKNNAEGYYCLTTAPMSYPHEGYCSECGDALIPAGENGALVHAEEMVCPTQAESLF